jgi:hypothetical protein
MAHRDGSEPWRRFWIYALQALAQALAGKLTDVQALQVLPTGLLQGAFGWSATSDKSAAWAGAMATLLRRSGEREYVNAIVELLKYPIAAGPATDVLLRAMHEAIPASPRGGGRTTGKSALDRRDLYQLFVLAAVLERQPSTPVLGEGGFGRLPRRREAVACQVRHDHHAGDGPHPGPVVGRAVAAENAAETRSPLITS